MTARLTDAERGEVVWSDRRARPAEHLFAVQDEIVGRVGGALDGTWTGRLAKVVREDAEGQPTRSLEAYELYLLGAEAKHRYTAEGYEEAAGYLRRALALDPDFVKAMVTLSIVRTFQMDFAPDEEARRALLAEGTTLAERAVALDPEDPDALVRLAAIRVLWGERLDAWDPLVRAVDHAPSNPDVLAVAAWVYPWADQERAPLDWARRAVALNPGHPAWYDVGLAMAAFYAGDLALARKAAGRAPPDSPELLLVLGALSALEGDLEGARASFARFDDLKAYRSLSGYYFVQDLGQDPAFAPLVEGARRAGFPVTDAEALASN